MATTARRDLAPIPRATTTPISTTDNANAEIPERDIVSTSDNAMIKTPAPSRINRLASGDDSQSTL